MALPELSTLFQENGIPDSVRAKLEGEPFKVKTLKQFANFFTEKGQVRTLFCTKAEIEDGGIIGDLTQAWREAEAWVASGVQQRKEGRPAEPADEPLRPEDQQRLEDAYEKEYKSIVPASWRGPHSLLGNFHRDFLSRQHVVYHIKKIRSLEMAQSLGPAPQKERTRVNKAGLA